MIRLTGILLAALLLAACEMPRRDADSSRHPGGRLFVDYCVRCHLMSGAGGPAPGGLPARDLRRLTKSPAEIRETITYGFGKMPSFKDTITDDQIALIADYVATQIEYKVPHR